MIIEPLAGSPSESSPVISPSEGCRIPPARRDLAARVRLSPSLDILSELCTYTEVTYRVLSSLKLQPWQQSRADSKYFTQNLFARPANLGCCTLICCVYSSRNRNLALIESQKSHPQRGRDEKVTVPTFNRSSPAVMKGHRRARRREKHAAHGGAISPSSLVVCSRGVSDTAGAETVHVLT